MSREARLYFRRRPDRRATRADIPSNRRRKFGDRRSGQLGWLTLFRNTDESVVSDAIGECEVVVVPAGAPLLRAGEVNDCVYLLLSGQLAAYLDDALTPDMAIPIHPGQCIGELSAIDGNPVSALVVALTDSRMLKLPQELFRNRLMSIPGVARNLLIALAERMRRSNEITLEAQRKRLMLEHLQKELDVARRLQAGMLPLRSPLFPERSDIEVEGLMEPASNVGGDLFDVFFIDDSTLFFCIGDVSGHGISAALFMARAIGLIRVAAMGAARPDHLLERINDHLCIGNDTDMFVTLFCGFLDVATGRLIYSNGGHCAPVLLHDGSISVLPIPKGALAGAIPGLRYSANEIFLNRGDALICFTDGVTEAQTKTGEEFSEERLLEIVARNANGSLETLLDAVRREVASFTGNEALDDDCTLLAIKRP
ncbi:MAG TPA: SpoIIE family protein phosphatase [Burkholderiales bacterium]|nr:SpoIIE family protein phosphatase [Burkholderiales bacterium]